MSTRWYPLYQKGNPQLRIFLPNFWMKLVKNTKDDAQKPNQVMFHVSMGMSKHDMKSYLEKIYNVYPVEIRSYIKMGGTRTVGKEQYVVKDDDYKVCIITLPEDQKFVFPEVCPKDKAEKEVKDENKAMEETKKAYATILNARQTKPGLPGWFT